MDTGTTVLVIVSIALVLTALAIFVPSLIIFIINLKDGIKNKWPKVNLVFVLISGTIVFIFTLLFLRWGISEIISAIAYR